MRISDWSSDVCSSDLRRGAHGSQAVDRHAAIGGVGQRRTAHDAAARPEHGVLGQRHPGVVPGVRPFLMRLGLAMLIIGVPVPVPFEHPECALEPAAEALAHRLYFPTRTRTTGG